MRNSVQATTTVAIGIGLLLASLDASAASLVSDASRQGDVPDESADVNPQSPLSRDKATAGTLIGHGFTVGGALVGTHGSWSGPTIDQTIPTFMPYVGIFPFAWAIRGDATKAYCAGRFVTGSSQASLEHANAVAKSRTKAILHKAEVSDDEILDETGWDVTLKGKCGVFSWLGLYVGKPSAFKANTTIDGVRKARNVTSYVSVGLISSPISAFSLLAGISFWSIEGDATINKQITSLMIGVGTNIDLLTLFIK
jgi:hypothetical protein